MKRFRQVPGGVGQRAVLNGQDIRMQPHVESGKLDPEGGTLAGLTVEPDGSSHFFDELLGDVQAEARAALRAGRRAIGLGKSAENPRPKLRQNPGAMIDDRDAHGFAEDPKANSDRAGAG